MTQDDYDSNLLEGDLGFCKNCDAVSPSLDTCDICGRGNLLKLEDAHALEYIEITDDRDEDYEEFEDDYEGGSFL